MTIDEKRKLLDRYLAAAAEMAEQDTAVDSWGRDELACAIADTLTVLQSGDPRRLRELWSNPVRAKIIADLALARMTELLCKKLADEIKSDLNAGKGER